MRIIKKYENDARDRQTVYDIRISKIEAEALYEIVVTAHKNMPKIIGIMPTIHRISNFKKILSKIIKDQV